MKRKIIGNICYDVYTYQVRVLRAMLYTPIVWIYFTLFQNRDIQTNMKAMFWKIRENYVLIPPSDQTI